MSSERAIEGVLLIDHRNSPGLVAQDLIAAGLDPTKHLVVGAGKLEERATLLAGCGIDDLYLLPFDERIAALRADEFVSTVLVDTLAP